MKNKTSLALAAIFCLTTSSFADYLEGTITHLNRKSMAMGFSCSAYDGDHLVWVKVKGTAVVGSTSTPDSWIWFVVGSDNEIGKQSLALAMTAMTTGTTVRVGFNGGAPVCSDANVKWLTELTLSADGAF